MTDTFICQIEGCDWTGDSKPSLRSHVSGSKDDDHQQARKSKAWEEWYPADEGGDPSAEGGSTPADEGSDDPADYDPTKPTDDGGDGDGSPTLSEGGPDPSEEYREQWSAGDAGSSDQETNGSEGGSDPSDEGGSGGSDRSGDGDNGIGAGAALVAGSLLVGLIAVLTRSNDGEEPIEVESTAEDVDPDSEGAAEEVDLEGWGGTYE